jgi:hypothetical protein
MAAWVFTYEHGVAEGFSMKKIAIALVACIAAASLAGCVAGKGKAPVGKGKGKAPAAVVTKG